MNCLLSVFSHRFQIYTELLAEYILPQISQIYTLSLQKNATQSHKR